MQRSLHTLGPSVDLTRSPSAMAPTNDERRAFSPRSSVAWGQHFGRRHCQLGGVDGLPAGDATYLVRKDVHGAGMRDVRGSASFTRCCGACRSRTMAREVGRMLSKSVVASLSLQGVTTRERVSKRGHSVSRDNPATWCHGRRGGGTGRPRGAVQQCERPSEITSSGELPSLGPRQL